MHRNKSLIKLPNRPLNRLSIQPMHLQLLLRLGTPRHPPHTQMLNPTQMSNSLPTNSIIQPPLRIMLLGNEYSSLHSINVEDEVLDVQRLYGEDVDHADVYF